MTAVTNFGIGRHKTLFSRPISQLQKEQTESGPPKHSQNSKIDQIAKIEYIKRHAAVSEEEEASLEAQFTFQL